MMLHVPRDDATRQTAPAGEPAVELPAAIPLLAASRSSRDPPLGRRGGLAAAPPPKFPSPFRNLGFASPARLLPFGSAGKVVRTNAGSQAPSQSAR